MRLGKACGRASRAKSSSENAQTASTGASIADRGKSLRAARGTINLQGGSMSTDRKPKLLWLRFLQPKLPSFVQLHMREQERCMSQYFDVTLVNERSCDYQQLCDQHEPDLAIFETGVYTVPAEEVKNTGLQSARSRSWDSFIATRIARRGRRPSQIWPAGAWRPILASRCRWPNTRRRLPAICSFGPIS